LAPTKSRKDWLISGWPFSFKILSEKATSWAVSREPSWNFASGRMKN
jgi:hypothetical protein